MERTQPLAKSRIDWSRYLTYGLVALLAAGLAYKGVSEARRAKLVKSGEVAPPVVGARLGGEAFDFQALRGKVVLLDFWATWCRPCRKEAPTLVKLAREYRERGLVLLMADQIASDQPAAVAAYVGGLAPDHPDNVQVVLAAEETLQSYLVDSFPTTYLISRDGRVVDAFSGLTSEFQLRRAVERALKQ